MPHTQLIEAVRRRVARTFAELSAGGADQLCESILIRDGAYCGRRFAAPAGHAIWFVEEDEIKFYDAAGKLTSVVATRDETELPQRIAA